ncbi:MAG TPA: RNA-binding domain-containing protein [Phenylobacterium sp.]|jgi:hypothetical protein|nr:RNA-binding domain-containing protein [Phenylobacterium sp.]
MSEPLASQLESLIVNPREDLAIEIKSWLDLSSPAHCATLAKAALAIANHGGGFIVVGLRETSDGQFEPDPNRPPSLTAYSQDALARIVAAYSEPPFQVAVHHVAVASGTYPVMQVPGGHRTPIQAKKGSSDNKTLIVGRVYIRRPGPESAEPASAAEWRGLLDRCLRAARDDLLDAIRGTLDGQNLAAAAPPPPSERDRFIVFAADGLKRWSEKAPITPTQVRLYPPGYYRVAYRVVGPIAPRSPADLLTAISRATTGHTGWSPWWVPTRDEIKPYWNEGALECFLGEGRMVEDPAHADFWRVSPDGNAVLVRGFDEDSHPDRVKPGTVFDVTLPVWRIGDCMLQAARFAEAIGAPQSEIIFGVQWMGLAGRELTHIEGHRHISPGRAAKQDRLDLEATLRADQIAERLPEILFDFLTPLYALFDLFVLPKSLVDQEVQKLRAGRF